MQTKVSVSFRIPKYAYDILEIMRNQNHSVEFGLGNEISTITLTCNMLDFSEVSDDWEFDDIDEYIKGVE